MLWIALSVACSTAIFLLFKWFNRTALNIPTIIVVNYATAVSFGFALAPDFDFATTIQQPFQPFALAIGVAFVAMFWLISFSTVRIGIGPATVANKMSVAIPTLLAFLLYKESIGLLKISGIILAVVALFLVIPIRKSKQSGSPLMWLAPIILFLGSGGIDAGVNFVQRTYFSAGGIFDFLPLLFGYALVAALLLFARKLRFDWKTIAAGAALGLVNFGSIFFLVQALNYSGLDASALFPLNNMAIVVLSAISAWWLFREPLSNRSRAGILLSLAAIPLIAFS